MNSEFGIAGIKFTTLPVLANASFIFATPDLSELGVVKPECEWGQVARTHRLGNTLDVSEQDHRGTVEVVEEALPRVGAGLWHA